MCCISLSGWSAPLPLCHKHPVTSRWWGQPGHGKPKGAVKVTDGRSLEGHGKPYRCLLYIPQPQKTSVERLRCMSHVLKIECD